MSSASSAIKGAAAASRITAKTQSTTRFEETYDLETTAGTKKVARGMECPESASPCAAIDRLATDRLAICGLGKTSDIRESSLCSWL